jgi:hypothetical protein
LQRTGPAPRGRAAIPPQPARPKPVESSELTHADRAAIGLAVHRPLDDRAGVVGLLPRLGVFAQCRSLGDTHHPWIPYTHCEWITDRERAPGALRDERAPSRDRGGPMVGGSARPRRRRLQEGHCPRRARAVAAPQLAADCLPSTASRFFTSSGIARPSIFFFTKLDCMMSFMERYT